MSRSYNKLIIRKGDEDHAVSSIIGTILMISITVVIIATVAIEAESYIKNLPPPPPSVSLIILNESGPSGPYYYNITFRSVSSPLNLYDIALQVQGPKGYSDIQLRSNIVEYNESGFNIRYRNIDLYSNYPSFTLLNTSLEIEFKSVNDASGFFIYNINVIDTAINKVIGSGYPVRTLP